MGAPQTEKSRSYQGGHILPEAGQIVLQIQLPVPGGTVTEARFLLVIIVVTVVLGIAAAGHGLIIPEAAGVAGVFRRPALRGFFRLGLIVGGIALLRLVLPALFEDPFLAPGTGVLILRDVAFRFRRPVAQVVLRLDRGAVALIGAHIDGAAAKDEAILLLLSAEIEAAVDVRFRLRLLPRGTVRRRAVGPLVLTDGGVEVHFFSFGRGLGCLLAEPGDGVPCILLHGAQIAGVKLRRGLAIDMHILVTGKALGCRDLCRLVIVLGKDLVKHRVKIRLGAVVRAVVRLFRLPVGISRLVDLGVVVVLSPALGGAVVFAPAVRLRRIAGLQPFLRLVLGQNVLYGKFFF